MNRLTFAIGVFTVLAMTSCGDDSEKSYTPFFKIANTIYATDYTTCKALGADYSIVGYRKSTAITDSGCELTFFEQSTEPPAGEYTVQGLSNNPVNGFVDVVVRGGDISTTYLAIEGKVTIELSNGKPEVVFSNVSFRSANGTTVIGSGRFKCQ